MGELQIRRARTADLDILTGELGQRQVFDDRMARQSRNLGMLLIAWRSGRPIGVIYLWLETAEEPEIRTHLPGTPILNHFEIHPDHRGAGAGTTLISEAERRLRKLGFRQVALAVEITNKRAARLYGRLGYKKWPHPDIRCYSLTDGNGVRHAEICQIMVKALPREV